MAEQLYEISPRDSGYADTFERDETFDDDFNDQPLRSPRRSNEFMNELERGVSRLSIVRGNKDKDRQKSISITRKRSSSDEKRSKKMAKNFELYHFVKTGNDWTVADRQRTHLAQEEIARLALKGKGKVAEQMSTLKPLRRAQICRLLEEKNREEWDKEAEWYTAYIEGPRTRDGKVRTMDVVIAQPIKRERPSSPHEKSISFLGERSDVREPIRPKGKDKGKEKGKDKGKEKDKYKDKGYDNDRLRSDEEYYSSDKLFTSDGRPVNAEGIPFDSQKGNGRQYPLPDPIGGPSPRQQSLPPAGPWNDPPPFHPQDNHPTDPFASDPFGAFSPQGGHKDEPFQFDNGIEILNDNHQTHGGQPGIVDLDLDLDQLLDHGDRGGQTEFKQARIDEFGGPTRQNSGRKKDGRPKLKPIRTYPEAPRRKRYQYGNSSVGSDEISVIFDPDEKSSMSSIGEDHDFVRRGSLKGRNRRPSMRRAEPAYREHSRVASYYSGPARRNSRYGGEEYVTEPARSNRRPRPDRRSTIQYIEPPRQIGYGRDDAPLSPVLTDRNYSPPRRAPPEVFYPSELARQRDLEKDREADEYMDMRRREERVLRQEKELDDRDYQKANFGERQYYHDDRDYRGGREYRDDRDYRDGREVREVPRDIIDVGGYRSVRGYHDYR